MKNNETIFIQSPLNYTGGKYKLLNQIIPLFPKKINTFIDLFCGGCNVGININASTIILNDKQKELIDLYNYFQTHTIEKIIYDIKSIINDFHLSRSSEYGYSHYQCNSTDGLSKYNRNSFLALRNEYNLTKNILYLFVLIIFSFNNQIRFNSKGLYNLPCGKRDFNIKMQHKLSRFCQALQQKHIILSNMDFKNFTIQKNDNTFIYIDPPYLLGRATYNENGSWTLQDEYNLLNFLDKLNSQRIKFALSNVIFHKGLEHSILKEWVNNNPNLSIHYIKSNYKNCNYQTKKQQTQEILITNYLKGKK